MLSRLVIELVNLVKYCNGNSDVTYHHLDYGIEVYRFIKYCAADLPCNTTDYRRKDLTGLRLGRGCGVSTVHGQLRWDQVQ
jgi:hypothetical protein